MFEGTIIDQHGLWNTAGTRLFTAHTVAVSRAFKGEVPSTITVVTNGGELDGTRHYLPHGISLSIGEEALFFCRYFENSAHPDDRFLMLNGQSGIVRYNFDRNGFQAEDVYGTYGNVQSGLLGPIASFTGVPPVVYDKNGFEKLAEEWLEDNFALLSMNGTVIDFSFDNIQTVGTDKLEFDVFAKTNTTGIRFASTELFLEYNSEAFGTQVVQNGHIQVERGVIVDSTVYTINLADHNDSTVVLDISSANNPTALYPLSANDEQMVHITLDVQNLFELVTLTMDDFLMSGQSTFYDDRTQRYRVFDDILTEDPIELYNSPMITGFYGADPSRPDHITAGTGEVLTIEGMNFGDTIGKVRFYNADTPSFSSSEVETNAADVVTDTTCAPTPCWTEDKIKVLVPSADAGNSDEHTAGTGFFTVELPSGDIANSNDVLIVDYSVHNRRKTTTPPEAEQIFFGDTQDGDGNPDGQLVLTLANNMAAAQQADIIERSLCDWNVQTSTNWIAEVPSSTPPTTAANMDGVNLVYFGPEAEFMGDMSNLSAYTIWTLGSQSRTRSCGGSSPATFQSEVDIVFRESANLNNMDPTINVTGWYYETNFGNPGMPSSTEADFYSTVLHELGHVHMLRHVRESTKVMTRSLEVGEVLRSLAAEDVAGANYVLASSSTAFGSGSTCNEEIGFVGTQALCTTGTHFVDHHSESHLDYWVDGDELFFMLSNGKAGEMVVYLYDSYGRLLQLRHFDDNLSSPQSINLKGINNTSMLFLSVRDSQNRLHSGKISLIR